MIDLVIIGNLTKDPAQRTVNGTNGPKTVADFTVAVNGRRQGEEPTFVRVTVWEKTAENCSVANLLTGNWHYTYSCCLLIDHTYSHFISYNT